MAKYAILSDIHSNLEALTTVLEKCRELGITRVLMVCDQNNIASAKTIIKNGGVLENEVMVDGDMEQRYWIDLT